MNPRTNVAIFVGMIALTNTGLAHGEDRGKGWHGEIAKRPGDETFHRIYVEDATLWLAFYSGCSPQNLWNYEVKGM